MNTLAMGLNICRDKNIRDIDSEGDLQLCIQAVIKKDTASWRLEGWIQKVWILLENLGDFSISHIYHEADSVGYLLANYELSQEANCIVDANLVRWTGLDRLVGREMLDGV